MSFMEKMEKDPAAATSTFRNLSTSLQVGGAISSLIQSRRNAAVLRDAGRTATRESRREGAAIQAQERVRRASSGIRHDTGSSLDTSLALAEAFERRALREGAPYFAQERAQIAEGNMLLAEGLTDAGRSFLGSKLEERLRRADTSGHGATGKTGKAAPTFAAKVVGASLDPSKFPLLTGGRMKFGTPPLSTGP